MLSFVRVPKNETDFNSHLSLFLVADKQLHKRLCPSVGLLVRRSVGPSVRRSVGHARVVTLELKTRKTCIYDAAVGIVCVCVGGGLGE